MIGCNGMSHMLQHDGFTGFGRGNQQTALAFADRSNHIDNATGNIFLCADIAFQFERFIRMQRCQVFEQHPVFGCFGRGAVDFIDFDQCKIPLSILGRSDFTFNGVTRMKIETPDLGRGNIDIVCRCHITGIR